MMDVQMAAIVVRIGHVVLLLPPSRQRRPVPLIRAMILTQTPMQLK